MVRAACFALYAALAALGIAVLARPAALWVLGLGVFGPVLPWPVPLGWMAALLAVALAASAVALVVRAALGWKTPSSRHVGFLLLVALAFALRASSGDAWSPPDPEPRLLEGLGTAAGVLDAQYSGTRRYAPTAALLQGALSALPPPGFVHRARELPLRARILHGMRSAQTKALPGDLPGTVYVCISPDEQRAWLSALSLRGVLPATMQARAGTHAPAGRDPLLPEYPNARRSPR